MKAAVLHEARQPLKIEELEMPVVDDEDVLIKVVACGVCHTDLKVVEGRNRFTPPTILGHEVAGTLEQVGTRCRDFKAGDRVIIGMRYKCGRCRYCLTARENLCERRPAPPSLRKRDGTSSRAGMSVDLLNTSPYRDIWSFGFLTGCPWRKPVSSVAA
jgi:D-arabinose 1-dehydrogenase-like Zn-dependent alcohol dehydrogenase